MLRFLLLRLLILLLPFVLFGLYLWVVRKRDPFDLANWNPAPLILCTSVAFVALAISFFFLAFTQGEKAGATYTPARFEDGKLIPGKLTPAGAEAEKGETEDQKKKPQGDDDDQ